MKMRRLIKFGTALALTALLVIPATPALAVPPLTAVPQDSFAGFAGAVNGVGSAPCLLIKYVGTTVGKPTVEVAAGGDMTMKIAGVADATTGRDSSGVSPNSGIWDLSTPHASVDTMGELVSLINTTGTNWRAVLVSCLASDLTDNTLDTLTATEASTPAGVPVLRDSTVASATSVFTAQVALLPTDAASNISFFLSGANVGGPSGSTKVNPNPLINHQLFVQHIREKITSAGTIGLLEVLAVKRTYDYKGQVSESVRTVYAETGAATTVEKVVNFHAGPIPLARGEFCVVRQSTGTGLTAQSVNGFAFAILNR
jgi:hypothetical protein